MVVYRPDDYDFSEEVKRLMNVKSFNFSENAQKILDENPNSFVLSWMDTAISAWSFIRTVYETRGIFPPSIMIDRKAKPETENNITQAAINAAWRFTLDSNGKVKIIIPTYVECRIYHKNVMKHIRGFWNRYIPRWSMSAYMMCIVMHEFIHYINFYDYSYEVDKTLSDGHTVDEYTISLDKMYQWICNKDQEKIIEDECETEHDAIIQTLRYMAYSAFGAFPTSLEIIPGGPFDKHLRRQGNDDYNMASYMCEYNWYRWERDFKTDAEDKDRIDKLSRHMFELIGKMRRYAKKNPAKMFIID